MLLLNQHSWKSFVIICAILMLSACGLFGSKAEPTATPSAPVTLKYATFNRFAVVEDALIKQFQTEHPNLKIDKEQFRLNPLQYLTSTPPPDMMTIAPSLWLDQAIEQGLVTDISDIWQQAGLGDAYPANLRVLSERNGKQYFLPIGYNWNAIYYNKQIFAQYNLQPPKTWEEFTQICDTLLVNGVTPLALSGRNSFMASLWIDYLDMRLNGPDFHRQLETGQIAYDDVKVRAVFELWHSLIDKGYFLEDSRNLQTLSSLTAIIRGDNGQLGNQKAAMTLTGPFFLNDLPDKFRGELDFFAFPMIDPAIPASEVVFSLGYMVPANAPHRLEALTFLAYLGSDPAQTLLAQNAPNGLYAPARATAKQSDLPATILQGLQLVQNAKTVDTPYFISVEQKVQFAINEMLRQLLTGPTSSKPFDLDNLLAGLETARQAK
jgi:ABC-type glycerol-3-phosphate transport system substrate-binding protein